MKIADLDFYLLDPAGGAAESADRTVLVRLSTASGQEGWGEARIGWRASELAPRRESLLPILAGRNVADIEELLELDGLAPSGLRAAVEMASWDLIARAARQPLFRLWGGEYRPRVPLVMGLPETSPERAGELARDLMERGFATQSIVATGNVEQDLAVVRFVREATTDRVKLRIDGAGKFAAEDAREMCRRLERAGVQLFVDPLATGLDGFAALARQTTVALAVSAPIRSPSDLFSVARGTSSPHVIIDVGLVGGLWAARKCAIVAAAAQLPASLRGGLGLGVALAATLQLAAATPSLGHGHECALYQLHQDVLRERPGIADGTIAVPQATGLGVEVDRSRIEAFLVT
jgi:L-alanine-DL-glutamate epimerase-like enolase superfamily enzyme